jgi:beta-lactamase class A
MIPATAVLTLAATVASATTTPTPRPSPAALEGQLAALAAEAGGVAGVGILHVESGQRASLRGGERFCMASVYKLPIAIALLRRVDRGQSSLEQEVTYGARDLRPGIAHSAIVDRAAGGTASATVRELLEAMLIESDNTASDLVMGLVGGPAAVTAQLREAGLSGIDVSRPEGQIALDYWGVTGAPPPAEWTLPMFDRLRAKVAPASRRAAAEAFASDVRDTATPDAMATLLARLQKGELLQPASTALVLDVMTRATTGPDRLKGLLPRGTVVAHKTGTGGDTEGVNSCTNDVGLITLPDGSHVAVAVFVRSSPRPLAGRERAIAAIGRAAYDRWSRPGPR